MAKVFCNKLVKLICIVAVIAVFIVQVGCRTVDLPVDGKENSGTEAVRITDMGAYFDVVLDYRTGISQEEMGKKYGEAILEVVPNYEELIDSYIKEMVGTKNRYNNMLVYRVEDILLQVNQSYKDEINGIGSIFSGGEEDVMGDGKLSKSEFCLFNLIPDVIYATACSVTSVFDERSETGNNILYRNVDWYGGSNNQIPKIGAIITIKYSEQNDICFVSYLGFMGVVTAINDQKIFAGVLNSSTGTEYTSRGRNSYAFDLREALEQFNTLDEVAEYMISDKRHYAFNHLIALADPKETKIVENNFSGIGPNNNRVKRALRDVNSELNNGIEWGISNSIAAVNSFVLKGNFNNHNEKMNKNRWETLSEQLKAKGEKVSFEEIRELATYTKSGKPTYMENGDIYCKLTQQMMVIEPETMRFEVFFFPKDAKEFPEKPEFVEVNILDKLN